MLKNLSVSAKGFIAFGILATIAIASSTFIYNRAVEANHQVAETELVNQLVDTINEFSADLSLTDMHLKTFLLTGNREYSAEADKGVAEMKSDMVAIEKLFTESAPSELPRLKDAFTRSRTGPARLSSARSS